LAAKHKADLLKSLCMLTHLNHAKDMIVADRAGTDLFHWAFGVLFVLNDAYQPNPAQAFVWHKRIN
jgi:hypothetical protein